jgi:hypothetical protein
MTRVEPRRVTLELDSAAEPITGRMRDESGHSLPFAGWLGLAAALGSVLESTQGVSRPKADPDPARSGGERAR